MGRLLLLMLLAACSAPIERAGAEPDAGSPDGAPLAKDAAMEPDSGTSSDEDGSIEDAGAAAIDAEPPDANREDAGAEDTGSEDTGVSPSCIVSLCMAGAVTREDGANPDVGAICSLLPGVIEDCDQAGCYPMFAFSATGAALEALITTLDTNADGAVDGADDPCAIHVVGYSWGGVNVTHLAEDFFGDARVDPSRAVIDRMVVLDAYSPLEGATIEVPAGVIDFWCYRHSVSPSFDCSAGAPLGPYEGLPPLCSPSSNCRDYDYSLDPSATYQGLFGSYSGENVGHCGVPDAAGPALLHNLEHGIDSMDAPPSVPVGAL